MSECREPFAKKVKTHEYSDFEGLTKEELISRLVDLQNKCNQECGASAIINEGVPEIEELRQSEQKLREQQIEATRRENVLVMRLTKKEQEVQEYLNQIQELKQYQNPSATQLRSMLLDPAVNLMFNHMKQEMDNCKQKVEETQNELSAWKFTPDSHTGKRLMAKCRQLYQENEDLGKVIASGRVAKLEAELSLQKSFSDEIKKSQTELDEFLVELEEDVEGMQSTIYYLQQQIKELKEQLGQKEEELVTSRGGKITKGKSERTTSQSPPCIKQEILDQRSIEENSKHGMFTVNVTHGLQSPAAHNIISSTDHQGDAMDMTDQGQDSLHTLSPPDIHPASPMDQDNRGSLNENFRTTGAQSVYCDKHMEEIGVHSDVLEDSVETTATNGMNDTNLSLSMDEHRYTNSDRDHMPSLQLWDKPGSPCRTDKKQQEMSCDVSPTVDQKLQKDDHVVHKTDSDNLHDTQNTLPNGNLSQETYSP